MAQETTGEFARRLNMAVDGHPLAPTGPHGQQRWLIGKLEQETGVGVSPNTMNKWFRGLARPREDKVRALARVLGVDEVWLAMGRRPGPKAEPPEAAALRATGASLLLAGLFEVEGHPVSFPSKGEGGVSFWVSYDGERVGFTVVTPSPGEARKVSFMVPEPVNGGRIVAVLTRDGDGDGGTKRVDVVDLTAAPRKTFGGFSVIEAETREGGRFKIEGQRNLLAPAAALPGLPSEVV